MKKTTIILFLAALMLIGGNAQAQGKKKIRITYRSAKRLVEKIEANPNAETLYLFRLPLLQRIIREAETAFVQRSGQTDLPGLARNRTFPYA